MRGIDFFRGRETILSPNRLAEAMADGLARTISAYSAASPLFKPDVMRSLSLLALGAIAALSGCGADSSYAGGKQPTAAATPFRQSLSEEDLLARGEYLIRTTGCNDCHTAGYAEQQGNVDKSQWLTGSPMGTRGRGAPPTPPICA
ncbi:hypothetical protein M2650_11300 [Luteimonas sp. SX5]|uniref:Cytochrome c domain-containing protein n=1 Tax=Luteimonas galliterrae TaxID=2940486 RepID=A0ABT0MK22_9GAMM|nr:hypothetical protein [Luteimonas galliterrae]MCL1635210.1 hypothetical protein [Luteimonas galliterrae]